MITVPGVPTKETLGEPPFNWKCGCGVVYDKRFWLPVRESDGWHWATIKRCSSCGVSPWKAERLTDAEVAAIRDAGRAQDEKLKTMPREQRHLGHIIADAAKHMTEPMSAKAPVGVDEDSPVWRSRIWTGEGAEEPPLPEPPEESL